MRSAPSRQPSAAPSRRAATADVAEGLAEANAPPVRLTLAALFIGFLEVSLCAFGGPLVWARRMVVDQRHWLSDQEFAETLSFCQFLPGPNIVSLTVCVGARFRGGAGALSALAGFVVIPWTIGFAVGALYLRYAHIAALQHILRGVSAAAAGLIIGTGFRLLLPYRRRPIALLFAALAFAGLAFAGMPLLLVVVVLVPLSIAAAGREGATAA
jgi:chromate transporter